MLGRLVPALALIVAAVGLALSSDAALAERYVLSIGRQAQGSVHLGPVISQGSDSRSFAFRLPSNAHQGPNTWYRVKLQYKIRFSEDTRPGIAWVTTDTQGAVSSQIEYALTTSARRVVIEGSSLALNTGIRRWRLKERSDSVTFTNYLPYAGIQGGRNRFRVRVEATKGVRIDGVDILGTTGVIVTDRTPFPLRASVTVSNPKAPIHVGATVTMTATITNPTATDAGEVLLGGLRYDHAALELRGQPKRHIASGRQGGKIAFSFTARRAGAADIWIGIKSAANRPVATTRIVVVEPEPAMPSRQLRGLP